MDDLDRIAHRTFLKLEQLSVRVSHASHDKSEITMEGFITSSVSREPKCGVLTHKAVGAPSMAYSEVAQ